MNYLVTVYKGCEVVREVQVVGADTATAIEDFYEDTEYETDVRPLPYEYLRQRTPTPPA